MLRFQSDHAWVEAYSDYTWVDVRGNARRRRDLQSGSRDTSRVTLGRDQLVAAITDFLANQDAAALAAMRAAVVAEIDRSPNGSIGALARRLATAGDDWDYYESDPIARRLHHVLADHILRPGSSLHGIEHVHAVAGKPVVIFANHLSYADANLVEVLLHRAGGD